MFFFLFSHFYQHVEYVNVLRFLQYFEVIIYKCDKCHKTIWRFFLPFIWNIKIKVFINPIEVAKFYLAWIIIWYKIWNEKFSLNESYVVLKLGGSQNFGMWWSLWYYPKMAWLSSNVTLLMSYIKQQMLTWMTLILCSWIKWQVN